VNGRGGRNYVMKLHEPRQGHELSCFVKCNIVYLARVGRVSCPDEFNGSVGRSKVS
jgi:hypothetical protein